MRIIHFSDVHLSKSNEKDLNQYYLTAVLEDLYKFDSQSKIDLILITGDSIHRGGESFNFAPTENPFDYFKQSFSDKIVQKLDRDIPIIYSLGNHDLIINEETIDEMVETGMDGKLLTTSAINSFIDNKRDEDYVAFKKQNKFKEFEKKLQFDCIDKYHSNFESAYIMSIDGQKIGIASLNSSWRCTPHLPEKSMSFGSRQILEVSDFFNKHNTALNIGLMHHPPHLFEDAEKREIINFLELKNIDFIFCGHSHKSDSKCLHGVKGNLYFVTAKSAFNDPREKVGDYQPGYCVVDIVTADNLVTTYFRKYVHSRVEFDKDTEAAQDGTLQENMKSIIDTNSFHELVDMTGRVFEARKDDIDSSLVVYGTDSSAPQKLREIFVMPKLTNTPESFAGPSKTYNSLESLINAHKRILIVGRKETGKTTLINRIFTEISGASHIYQQIPIYLDFNDIAKKKITTLIRHFLNIGANKAKELLDNSKIILLIDNIIENESKESQLGIKALNDFIQKYSNTSIIGTTSTQIDVLLSTEDIIFKRHDFLPIYINSVKTEQFKSLAKNWFNKSSQIWINNNLDKLIKTFTILRIPHTFFSMSLFLWIIEKQENFKPHNHANLVDTFLKYILEGLKAKDSKAGTYNYERKIELLSEISLQMYKKGDKSDSYALKESQILACIENNFTLNQRTWDPSEKLCEFIKKGILIKHTHRSSYVSFRFDSFFQYLLSLNIDNNQEFKKEVFNRDNILSFIDC
ncbi:MAG: metallophosphoesterase [Victivallaceae bacterium]|nr:metallophosphoesterase [Victivallaceae bacterium]